MPAKCLFLSLYDLIRRTHNPRCFHTRFANLNTDDLMFSLFADSSALSDHRLSVLSSYKMLHLRQYMSPHCSRSFSRQNHLLPSVNSRPSCIPCNYFGRRKYKNSIVVRTNPSATLLPPHLCSRLYPAALHHPAAQKTQIPTVRFLFVSLL